MSQDGEAVCMLFVS